MKKKDVMLAILKESVALRSLSESVAYSWWGAGQFMPADVEEIRTRLNGLADSVPELRTPLARVFLAFDSLVAGARAHPLREGLKEPEVFSDKNPLHPLFVALNAEVVGLEAEITRRL